MTFGNWKENEPSGKPYAHMNFDSDFAWDTKDDANDQDNGFVCKRPVDAWWKQGTLMIEDNNENCFNMKWSSIVIDHSSPTNPSNISNS